MTEIVDVVQRRTFSEMFQSSPLHSPQPRLSRGVHRLLSGLERVSSFAQRIHRPLQLRRRHRLLKPKPQLELIVAGDLEMIHWVDLKASARYSVGEKIWELVGRKVRPWCSSGRVER